MSGQSLGLIETVGLTVAVEAADAAMKSANVELIGYELTKGGALVTVKLAGEVGAINAAVSAGVAAGNRVGSVYAWKVIARTASGIDNMIASLETCGIATPEPDSPCAALTSSAPEAKEVTIAVLHIESDDVSAGCTDISADVTFETPTDTAPATDTRPTAHEIPGISAPETAPLVFEDTAENVTQQDRKRPRARAKGARK